MNKIIHIFIVILFIFLTISKVNSVGNLENKKIIINNNSIFGKKYANFVCQENIVDISDKLKYKNLQKMALSCEISATADILSYILKKEVKEENLLHYLKKSKYSKLPEEKNGKKYWGNPNKGYVGYIDKLPNGKKARQRLMTGYGVLEQPINQIFEKYGLKTKMINLYNYNKNFSKKDHLKLILNNLEKGNMIQLWGDICTNPKYYNGKEHKCYYGGKPSWNKNRNLTWYYKDNNGEETKYTGLNGEHAFYLLGYKGKIENPTHIIVRDTYTGKHIYPTIEWMRKWGKMQYRSIIIYK